MWSEVDAEWNAWLCACGRAKWPVVVPSGLWSCQVAYGRAKWPMVVPSVVCCMVVCLWSCQVWCAACLPVADEGAKPILFPEAERPLLGCLLTTYFAIAEAVWCERMWCDVLCV